MNFVPKLRALNEAEKTAVLRCAHEDLRKRGARVPATVDDLRDSHFEAVRRYYKAALVSDNARVVEEGLARIIGFWVTMNGPPKNITEGTRMVQECIMTEKYITSAVKGSVVLEYLTNAGNQIDPYRLDLDANRNRFALWLCQAAIDNYSSSLGHIPLLDCAEIDIDRLVNIGADDYSPDYVEEGQDTMARATRKAAAPASGKGTKDKTTIAPPPPAVAPPPAVDPMHALMFGGPMPQSEPIAPPAPSMAVGAGGSGGGAANTAASGAENVSPGGYEIPVGNDKERLVFAFQFLANAINPETADIAKAYGLSAQTFRNYINGKTEPSTLTCAPAMLADIRERILALQDAEAMLGFVEGA